MVFRLVPLAILVLLSTHRSQTFLDLSFFLIVVLIHISFCVFWQVGERSAHPQTERVPFGPLEAKTPQTERVPFGLPEAKTPQTERNAFRFAFMVKWTMWSLRGECFAQGARFAQYALSQLETEGRRGTHVEKSRSILRS